VVATPLAAETLPCACARVAVPGASGWVEPRIRALAGTHGGSSQSVPSPSDVVLLFQPGTPLSRPASSCKEPLTHAQANPNVPQPPARRKLPGSREV
jgi:hypothetical protein